MHGVTVSLVVLFTLTTFALPAQVQLSPGQQKALSQLQAQVTARNQQEGTQVHYDSERMSISVDSRVLMLSDYSHYVASVIASKTYVVFQYFFKSQYPFNAFQATEINQHYYVRVSVGDKNKNIRIRDGTFDDIRLALLHFLGGTSIKDLDKAHTIVANLVENGWFSRTQ
jgi:hypothetical protein